MSPTFWQVLFLSLADHLPEYPQIISPLQYLFIEKSIFLFSRDAINLSKVTLKTLVMLLIQINSVLLIFLFIKEF